ncbi:MAG: aminotransferase class I/II-fold pyridoxal phosphate-dependent enzyme [Lachnospiraceae bacterium]|nr:aminotransferase class I/II-fold pyridoxal phosphate-dependent enzyme [Lachnospiraceae bacterium]
MADLLKSLSEYNKENIYPFHMPGHKRAIANELPYGLDITEINGFDNLNAMTEGEILWQMTKDASSLYGENVSLTRILLNGATSGIMAAIRAVCEVNDTIVIARNCHKSVYRTAEILGLNTRYVYPDYIEEYGVFAGLSIDDLTDSLRSARREMNAKALVVTSPTYEGIVLDIKAISEVCHSFNMVLIVDEAHGAHLPFIHPELSAINNGADIVIESLHKTLPAMTQTAIVHLTKEGVSRDGNLAKSLDQMVTAFASSSPSYLLMASVDECFNICRDKKRFDDYEMKIKAEREAYRGLKNIGILDEKSVYGYAYDEGKLVFLLAGVFRKGENRLTASYGQDALADNDALALEDENALVDYTGYDLMEDLREFKIECEMASDNYLVAMTSIMDSEEGFKRLREAVFKIDEGLVRTRNICPRVRRAKKEKVKLRLVVDGEEDRGLSLGDENALESKHTDGVINALNVSCVDKDSAVKLAEDNAPDNPSFIIADQAMSIAEARMRDVAYLDIDKIYKQLANGITNTSAMKENVTGFVAGDYIMRYPPGVPIVAPGERITRAILDEIMKAPDKMLGLVDGKVPVII